MKWKKFIEKKVKFISKLKGVFLKQRAVGWVLGKRSVFLIVSLFSYTDFRGDWGKSKGVGGAMAPATKQNPRRKAKERLGQKWNRRKSTVIFQKFMCFLCAL